ncbi:regulator of sigma D [Escherichia coli]|nr:regulator of sigma D [Escherichia coli]
MLNQLDNLTERVRGSNKLVDRWLHVRKHLLVAYYNLVGIKPGKESYMRLNEKPLMIFVRAWSITCLPDISVFMSAFFISWKATGNSRAPRRFGRNSKPILNRLWITTIPVWKPPSIMIITLSFNRFI